jgi:tetratricopeptide (TPR) repeat protein
MIAAKLGKMITAGTVMLFMAGCASPSTSLSSADNASENQARGSSYQNSELAAFMVGQFALKNGDLAVAADAFTIALAQNQDNPYLLNLAFQTQYFSGDIEAASDLAARIERSDDHIMLSSEPAAAMAAMEQDWEALYVLARHMVADGRSHHTGTIMVAWALAAQGQGDAGLVMLDSMDQFLNDYQSQTRLSQQALMAEYIGNAELAVAYALDLLEQENLDQNVVIDMVGILLRNGNADEGILWINRLGLSFPRARMLADIESGISPLLKSPGVINMISTGIVTSQIDPMQHSYQPISLARLYLAAYLDRNNDYAKYLIAESYIEAGLLDDGVAMLSLIPDHSVWYPKARINIAVALRSESGQGALALTVINDLLDDYPENPLIWAEKALTAQRNQHHAEAEKAFTKAMSLGLNNGRMLYYLAIAQADQGKDDLAETSFRQSIEQAPFNAYSLNYFGYWLIEKNRGFEEAKAYIQQAVDKQPENGAFVDSLGWVYFKMGDYQNALIYLERAAMLIPDDPVITDHLGDVYWALERQTEAVHEWRRALIFAPDAELEKHIQTKIIRTLADE